MIFFFFNRINSEHQQRPHSSTLATSRVPKQTSFRSLLVILQFEGLKSKTHSQQRADNGVKISIPEFALRKTQPRRIAAQGVAHLRRNRTNFDGNRYLTAGGKWGKKKIQNDSSTKETNAHTWQDRKPKSSAWARRPFDCAGKKKKKISQ